MFYEDINVGDVSELGRHTFHADEIKSFARRFDPQRFHVDETEAEKSHFGALCASGWHTGAVFMHLLVEYRRRDTEARAARGEATAQWGPAFGFRDLKWLRPVYAGDTIDYRIEVTETRVSNSRPDTGLVTSRTTGTNQNGEPVISFNSTVLVQRRTGAT